MSPKDTLIQLTRDFKPSCKNSSDYQILEEWRKSLSQPHRLFYLASWRRVGDLLGHINPSINYDNFNTVNYHGWKADKNTEKLFLALKSILDEEEEVKMEDFL